LDLLLTLNHDARNHEFKIVMSLIGLLGELKKHVILLFTAQPQPAWSVRFVFGTAFLMLWRHFWLKGELRCSTCALLPWLPLAGLLSVSKDERFVLSYGTSINQDHYLGQQFTSGEKNDTEGDFL